MTKKPPLLTIVQMQTYAAEAKRILHRDSQDEVELLIAANPKCGDLIPGTGGVRKVRIANKPSKGKSGGARVVYFYHNKSIPAVLITVFDKNEKDNLSKGERNNLKKLTARLKAQLQENNKRKK